VRTRSPRLIAGIAGLAVLAGCTTTSPGTAVPAPDATGTESTSNPAPTSDENPSGDELPSDGAPKVDNAIDTTRFQEDPCLTLTSQQAQQLAVPFPGKPDSTAVGNGCRWRNADTNGSVGINFLTRFPRGLSNIYKGEKEGKWAFFEEIDPIAGYPAVAYDIVDDRSVGSCAVAVGASDEIVFDLDLQLPKANVDQEDPCKAVADVAELFVQTMKAG